MNEWVHSLTLLHSEWPKLHRVLAILSAIALIISGHMQVHSFTQYKLPSAGDLKVKVRDFTTLC